VSLDGVLGCKLVTGQGRIKIVARRSWIWHVAWITTSHYPCASNNSGGCWLKKSQSSGDGSSELGRGLGDAGLRILGNSRGRSWYLVGGSIFTYGRLVRGDVELTKQNVKSGYSGTMCRRKDLCLLSVVYRRDRF